MGPPLAWNNSTAQKAWRTTRLAEPERSQPKIDFSENHLRCELMENEYCSASASCSLNHAACTVKLAKTMSYNLLFEQGNSFFFSFSPSYWPLKKNSRWIPPHSPWWYFDFSFPFPVYHSLIRSPHAVTCSIQLHLLKRPEMLLSIGNIVQTDCSSSSEENINVYCSEIKPLPQVPAAICLLWGEKKNLQQGLLIPCLFVVLLRFSTGRLSRLLRTIWTSRWNDKCQEMFISVNKLPNPCR